MATDARRLRRTNRRSYDNSRDVTNLSALRRLTRTTNGEQANAGSNRPAFNYMGDRVAFDSAATNLTFDALDGTRNVFSRRNALDPETVFGAGFE